MPQTISSASINDMQPSLNRSAGWATWLREPLLHFVLLGALLFAIDHFAFDRKADDPKTIMVDARVDKEIRQIFHDARNRDPDAKELEAMRQAWIDNEVLYREGMALQVDRGDQAIRDRVIFKALSIVESNLKRPPLDDNILRKWFEERRAKYDEPARFDFQEAVLAGEQSDAALRSMVHSLNTSTTGGEAKADLRVFKGRPRSNLVQSYGVDFARALETATPGAWLALQTKDGLRAIQLVATTPAKLADFNAIRNVVLQDWTDAVMAEQRTAAVRVLAKKYTIRTEGAAK